MWIGSQRGWEDRPFGVKWQTFLGKHITYEVKVLIEKNFKQRLKKIRNMISLWKVRGLSIYGKVTIVMAFLLSKMIYPSSVLTSPPEIIKEFNTWVFQFLWNGKEKVTTRSNLKGGQLQFYKGSRGMYHKCANLFIYASIF